MDILATVAYAVEASFASAQIDILAVAMIRIVFAMGSHGRIITLTGASNISCLRRLLLAEPVLGQGVVKTVELADRHNAAAMPVDFSCFISQAS